MTPARRSTAASDICSPTRWACRCGWSSIPPASRIGTAWPSCARIRKRFPCLKHLFADAGYQGEVAACAAARERLRLEIVKRPRDAKGFHLLPRRWVIERTFAWLGRNRRLAKDFERLIDTTTAMAVLAIIQLLMRRLANS